MRTGRLEVLVDDTVVRELGPGQVLGELALLTGEQRSATVRARRDTTLLEIPASGVRGRARHRPVGGPVRARPGGRPAAHRRRAAASPRRRPSGLRWSPSSGSGAAVSPADVAAVGDALRPRLGRHLRVATPGVVGPDGLARAERDHDRVLLVAASATDGPDAAWRDFCLRQADAVVLVARSGDAGARAPGRHRLPPAAPTSCCWARAPTPEQRVAWVAVTDAWQLTLVDGDLATGLRPVADRLAGRSLGLVLAGGGARAFAHVGVLRELEDAGLHVDRVTGASIGAVIAGLHAMGIDGATLEEICYAEFVRRRPFSDYRPVRPLPGPWAPGARRDGAPLRHRHGARGAPAPALGGQRRPGQPHPPGAPARPPARRGPRVGPAARALRADRAGRRAAARRRRGARQPADRPARRARRGPGRGGDHRVGRRRPAPARVARACPASATP